jgi:anaerobic magnesium-protoporphyrin IX monomethyl ester cyclase
VVNQVLLGQGYSLRLDPKLRAAAQPYAPLGTLYAAAVLRRHGYPVALFDSMLASSDQEWGRRLDAERPRFAVLYEDSFNYLTKMCLGRMRAAALRMTAEAVRRGCTVIVAGSDATDHPDVYLAAGAAAVVLGEGEATLPEALDALGGAGAGPLRDVPGLALPGAGGGVTRTPARPILRDLDTLPPPAWDLVDVERYRRIWKGRHGYFSMNAAASRGCPYHCNWCAKPIYGQRYTIRGARAVAEELLWLSRTYAPDHVSFMDDIFGLRPQWVEEFAHEVERLGVRVPFKCLCRADLLGERTVDALRRAGCRTVWLGAESGSQPVLDAMEKGTRVEQIRAAAERLRAAGIEVGLFLQLGYPGETPEDVQLTRQMVRDCRPDDIGISVAYPLPGTPFYRRVEAELGKKRHWEHSDDLSMMYRGPFPTRVYRRLHRLVHAEFRLRRLEELPRLGARQRATWLYHRLTLLLDEAAWRRSARAPQEGIRALPVALDPQRAAIPSEQPGP